ncbi:MarR family winged helix-turn-helix transcriptional regulator [Streptomyces sp. NPDC021093]|uniref:MarR family winged helix-turn-helix transcriptional regulator n=1 Tax=Streptomyces sp. NPDC021093 TaxID=3365112 RepID=UPI003791E7B9
MAKERANAMAERDAGDVGDAAEPRDLAEPGDAAEQLGDVRDEDFLRLDHQICFSLHAATRAFNSVYRSALKDLDLTYPQYLVMLVLWEDGELPVKKIGERLRLDSGTLSPLLKRLEAAGHVERRRSADDERSVTVRPTAEGTALRARALAVPRAIAASTGLSLDEVMDLRARLNALTAALDGTAPGTHPGSCATDETKNEKA